MSFTCKNGIITKRIVLLLFSIETTIHLLLICWVNFHNLLSNTGWNNTTWNVFTAKTCLDISCAHVNNNEFFLIESNFHFI